MPTATNDRGRELLIADAAQTPIDLPQMEEDRPGVRTPPHDRSAANLAASNPMLGRN